MEPPRNASIYRALALLSAVTAMIMSVRLYVALKYNSTKQNSIMRFSVNGSPKTLVFDNKKIKDVFPAQSRALKQQEEKNDNRFEWNGGLRLLTIDDMFSVSLIAVRFDTHSTEITKDHTWLKQNTEFPLLYSSNCRSIKRLIKCTVLRYGSYRPIWRAIHRHRAFGFLMKQ